MTSVCVWGGGLKISKSKKGEIGGKRNVKWGNIYIWSLLDMRLIFYYLFLEMQQVNVSVGKIWNCREKSLGSIAASTHINFGGLGEGADGVNVVVENDDSNHHPHAEQHGVCVGEPTAVLPVTGTVQRTRGGLLNPDQR